MYLLHYFYLFHFFIELTSARYGARADALAPRVYYNKASINQFITARANCNICRHFKQMSMLAPCWKFQQVMSLMNAKSL
jgi:hypothetical protein